MNKRLKLISSDEATPASKQITKPCTDCPWKRDAVPGWLGPHDPQEWEAIAHADDPVECHVHPNVQCAGLAIYRANVCKTPRDPAVLRLPADRERVLGYGQFVKYHARSYANAKRIAKK